MCDVAELAGQDVRLGVLGAAADLAETEGPNRALVLLALADRASHLGDLHRAHAGTSARSAGGSTVAASAATAAAAATLAASYPRGSGSTSLMVLPRCRATSSGRRRFLSPSTVAFAML